jgi:predicted transposase YbfD/YdcC
LAKFSLDDFQAAFSRWLQVVVADQAELAVAVDGKTSKQGFDPEGDPVQMLNVFAQDVKACLGQWPLGSDKSTEPEVLKAHLSELFEKYPALRLITGDALYAQRNLAELILASGHDYLFQIKANQPDILDAAENCFAKVQDHAADAHTGEKKGRKEARFLWVDLDNADYVRERLGFAGCRMLLRVDRETKNRQGKKTRETRYFITSLDPATTTPAQLLKYVRGHWQVENSLHHVKDRWWDEDRHWSRRPGLAERLASLDNVALTLLRLTARKTDSPLRARADDLCCNPLRALKLIGALD